MRGSSGAFLQSIGWVCCSKCLEKPASVEVPERRTIVARVKWWAQEFERQFKGPSNCQAWIKCGRRMGALGQG